MELLRGNGAPKVTNLAVAQLTCDCGGKVFRAFPLVVNHYNKLNPLDSQPSPLGNELQCIDCDKFAALIREEGKLPRWEFVDKRATSQKKPPLKLEE